MDDLAGPQDQVMVARLAVAAAACAAAELILKFWEGEVVGLGKVDAPLGVLPSAKDASTGQRLAFGAEGTDGDRAGHVGIVI